jgi:transposase-like protein
MVERMATLGGPNAMDLSREVNVPQVTLSRWLREAGRVGDMRKKKRPEGPPSSSPALPDRDARSTREWTPADKLRVVSAAGQCKEEELGELLRREGIHLAQLEEWRADILAALGSPPPRRKDPETHRLRELERELARKDKALAEVTALLVLRKKLEALFDMSEGEGDSTDEKNEKK